MRDFARIANRPLSPRQLARQTNDLIRDLMNHVAGDKLLLAQAVAGGAYHFRLHFLRLFQGFPVDESIANQVFHFFVTHWERCSPELSAKAFLDAVEVKAPVTEADVAKAWTVDSKSSEDGRRLLYGPDGSPQALLDRLRDVKDVH